MIDKYDVIILATKKNLKTLRIMVPYCFENLPCKSIVVIANKRDIRELEGIKNINVIDEESIYEGLSYSNVENIIKSITSEKVRIGWYLQQFLKLAWSYKTTDEKYIVIDADTIPLNKISFENERGIDLFTTKIEYNKPYFTTIENLFNCTIDKQINGSFVAEHMLFRKTFVLEMLDAIMNNTNIHGESFYEKILRSIKPSDLSASGFSEFETYGNYVFKNHRDQVEERKIRTQREAVFILGSNPSRDELVWAAKDYDLISIEVNDYKNTLMTRLVKLPIVRKHFHMKTLARYRTRVRTLYRTITRKQDFKYEEY